MSPTSPTTGALSRLERILVLLPRAKRPEGVTLAELERDFGVDLDTIRRDLELLTVRAGYLRAGDPGNMQIAIDADRVRITGKGVFDRPPRLGTYEALALLFGLRARILLSGGDEKQAARLADRLEGALANDALSELDPLPIEDGSTRSADAVIRDRALDAILERRPVRFEYLKPGVDAPDKRRLHPLTMVHAEGRWYLMGHDPDQGDRAIRSFRLDRILDLAAAAEASAFEPPADFDPVAHVSPERVFVADDVIEVTVDYSPTIARWIEEQFEGTRLEDGGWRVVHRVADREWLVQQVLQYGGEAVAHPPGRGWVLDALRDLPTSD